MTRCSMMTLRQIQARFKTQEDCLTYLVSMRWPEGVCCPRCGNDHVYTLKQPFCMSSGVAVAQAQAALGAIAFELLALQERLTEINRSLPVPTNQEAMLEDEIPPDLATEVSGCIECIRDDYLRQVIEALEEASRVTARDLERDHRERQKRRRRYGGR